MEQPKLAKDSLAFPSRGLVMGVAGGVAVVLSCFPLALLFSDLQESILFEWRFLVALLLSYLLGSIPFGLLAGWIAGKDIRREGSGNIGATNVYRVCGPKFGIPVLLLDGLKGFIPPMAMLGTASDSRVGWAVVLCGLAAILGHTFPVWLGFRGGKGVATSVGALLAILPSAAILVAMAVFLLVVLLTRYVSLGSMVGGVALVIAHLALLHAKGISAWSSESLPQTILVIFLSLLVIFRHRANIIRILEGTEHQFGVKASGGETSTSTNS